MFDLDDLLRMVRYDRDEVDVRRWSWPWQIFRLGAWALWVDTVWVARRVGYWIRPYDMRADARRWRWQARQRCQFSGGGLGAAWDALDRQRTQREAQGGHDDDGAG